MVQYCIRSSRFKLQYTAPPGGGQPSTDYCIRIVCTLYVCSSYRLDEYDYETSYSRATEDSLAADVASPD